MASAILRTGSTDSIHGVHEETEQPSINTETSKVGQQVIRETHVETDSLGTNHGAPTLNQRKVDVVDITQTQPANPSHARKVAFAIVTTVGALILALGVLMLLSQLLPSAGALTPAFSVISSFTIKGAAAIGISPVIFSSLITGVGAITTGVGIAGLVKYHKDAKKVAEFNKAAVNVATQPLRA